MTLALAPLPPLPAHQALVFLLQVVVLLTAALAMGALARRMGMPAIVGELTAGVVLGPSLLGHLAPAFSDWLLPKQAGQAHMLDALGLIGVLLLVGATGSHIDIQFMRRRGPSALAVFACGLIIPLGLGIALGYALPDSLVPDGADRTAFALLLGVAMGVSAVPVLAKTLTDMNLLHRDIGQLAMATCVADDTIAWCLLSVVAALATTGGLGAGLVAVLSVAGVVLAAWLVGRPLVRVGMRLAARSHGNAAPVAFAVLAILLGAAATQALKLEAVFGAFVVGILLVGPHTADPKRLAPLWTVVYGVLAPLYLATAGLRIDLTALADPVVALAAVAALVVAVGGKFSGAYLGGTLIRLPRWERLALGAGINARGVVEVVVAGVGLSLGLLNTTLYTIIVLVAIATSLMAPPLLRLAMKHVDHSADEEVRRQIHDIWRTSDSPVTSGDRDT